MSYLRRNSSSRLKKANSPRQHWRQGQKKVHYPGLPEDTRAISLAAKKSVQDFISESIAQIQKWDAQVGPEYMPRQLFITIGENALKLNRTDFSEMAFQRALKLKPFCHTSSMGMADCRLQQDNLKEAAEWMGKAYTSAPNVKTALKISSLLCIAGETKRAGKVIEGFVEEALKLQKPDSFAVIGTFLATRDPKDMSLWLKQITDAHNFEQPQEVIPKAVQLSNALRDAMPSEKTATSPYLDEYEKAAAEGSVKDREIARRIIRAYNGSGVMWESLHVRSGVDAQAKTSASFGGYQSAHKEKGPTVGAASPVRYIKMG